MNFYTELKNQMDLLNCNAKELSIASNLSPTLISRYLSNKRKPRIDSIQFEKIINGLYKIADEKNLKFDRKCIVEQLRKSLSPTSIDFYDFSENFNKLIINLKINTADLASSLNYDSSFISRIKNGTRRPSDLFGFIDSVSDYIVDNLNSPETKENAISLFKCSLEDIKDDANYKNVIENFLKLPQSEKIKGVENFLSEIDSYDINDYIKTNLKKVKTPTTPVILRNSKTYYGVKRIKTSRNRFFKNYLAFQI